MIFFKWLRHLAKHAQYFYFTPIRLGICTPSACSSTELNQLISYWFEKNFYLEAKIAEDGCETLQEVEKTKKFGTKQWISMYISRIRYLFEAHTNCKLFFPKYSSILSTFCLLLLLATLADALDLSSSFTSLVLFFKRLIKYLNLNEQPGIEP